MAKTNGNMYPRVKTCNPLWGDCTHHCYYCFKWRMMRRRKDLHGIRYRGMPRLAEDFNWQKALGGKAKTIFVCSMTDLFANNVSFDLRDHIINRCMDYPQNEYLWHTKNPRRFQEVDEWPPNSVLVTTIETDQDTELISCAPNPYVRFAYLQRLRIRMNGGDSDFLPSQWTPMPRLMVAIEPVMAFDMESFISWIQVVAPEIVSLGADTGGNKLPEPSEAMLREFVLALRDFVPEVRIKKNLRRLWPDVEMT